MQVLHLSSPETESVINGSVTLEKTGRRAMRETSERATPRPQGHLVGGDLSLNRCNWCAQRLSGSLCQSQSAGDRPLQELSVTESLFEPVDSSQTGSQHDHIHSRRRVRVALMMAADWSQTWSPSLKITGSLQSQ